MTDRQRDLLECFKMLTIIVSWIALYYALVLMIGMIAPRKLVVPEPAGQQSEPMVVDKIVDKKSDFQIV